jgi:hypothetical protein
MPRFLKDRPIWMYQMNPKRGTFYSRTGRLIGPTSAENLWKLIKKEGPVCEDWRVTKNFLTAKPGDPVIVRVNSGSGGHATGVIGFGHLSRIYPISSCPTV